MAGAGGPPGIPDWAKWLALGGGGLVVAVVLVLALSDGDDSSSAATTEPTSSTEAVSGTQASSTTEAPTTEAPTTATLGPGEAAGEIFLELADEEGPDSFAGGEVFADLPVSTTSTLVTTTTTTEPVETTMEGQVVVQPRDGSQPGLYGGTLDQASCDADEMLAFLQANFAKAQAWVDALNGDPDLLWGDNQTSLAVVDLPAYFAELTPVILLEDTRVTNHGFRDGRPTPRQSVLQAGTAVLVDKYGVPRARCACGNPLIPPRPSPTPPVYVGPQWAGWDPVTVVIIIASPAPIDVIVIIDVWTGDPFTRPVGGRGSTDIFIDDFEPPPAGTGGLGPNPAIPGPDGSMISESITLTVSGGTAALMVDLVFSTAVEYDSGVPVCYDDFTLASGGSNLVVEGTTVTGTTDLILSFVGGSLCPDTDQDDIGIPQTVDVSGEIDGRIFNGELSFAGLGIPFVAVVAAG